MTRLLKLVNGDTIVARWAGETKTHLLIDDPLKVETVTSSQGRYSLMTFWIPLGDNTIQIPLHRDHVIVYSEVTSDVHQNYINTLDRIKKPQEEVKDLPDEEEIEELIDFYKHMMSKGTIH